MPSVWYGLISQAKLVFLQAPSYITMSQAKRQKSPNDDAREEDEIQYSTGPLSLEALDAQYADPR